MELWTSSATHALLPLLASDAGLRLQLATGIASHERRFGSFGGGLLAARVRLRAGPRARAGRPRRARVLRRPDRRARLGAPEQLEPGAHRGRARWRCRSTGRPSSSCGTTRTATRRTPSTATTTAARCTTCARGATAASPTTRTRPRRWPASTRATSWRAASRGSTPTPATAGGRACCAARSTPSCSATGGTRARPGCAPCSTRPRAQGLELVDGHRGARAGGRRWSATLAASSWGSRQGLLDLGLAAGGRAGLRRPPRRAAHGGRGGRGGAAASGALERARARAAGAPVQRLGVPGDPRAGRRLSAAARGRPPRRARRGARRSGRLRAPCRTPPCATWRPTSTSRRSSRREHARPDPVLGVPAADRGRPGAPRAQAGREPGRPGRGGARAGPRPGGVARRGGDATA